MIDQETRYKAIVHYNHFYRSLRGVSKLYSVSKSSLQRWINANPNKKRKHRTRWVVKSEIEACIDRSFVNNPHLTKKELCNIVAKECNVKKSVNTMARWMDELNYSRKKVHRGVNYNAPSTLVDAFCNKYRSVSDDDIICIDEAGFYVGDCCRYGYSKRGTRILKDTSRTVRRSRFTLVMAISSSGVVDYKILANSCNKADFVDFVRSLPKEKVNGKTVVMDNISFHHSSETIDALRSLNCSVLHIPPYSPRYNAIEYAFSMVKATYRDLCNEADVNAEPDNYWSALVASIEMCSGFEPLFNKVRKSIAEYEASGVFARYDT